MKNRQKENPIDPKTQSVIDAFCTNAQKATDPLGSYTGVPEDERDVPVQDVDDL